MNENSNFSCICKLGYEQGAYIKAIENNIFTIYGNIATNNTIIMRYHGQLIDNICYEQYENNLFIKYFFDNNFEEIKTIALAKCTKSHGENYCGLINLENHDNITFSFFSPNQEPDEQNMTFNLPIQNNILEDFIDKYDEEKNTALPVVSENKLIEFLEVIDNIKLFFKNIFHKKISTN